MNAFTTCARLTFAFRQVFFPDRARNLRNLRNFCSPPKTNVKMRVLNVAEKNDAAKNIASLLGRGNSQRREGLSKFNKIYQFDVQLWNRNCTMMMTSVSGHLLGCDFTSAHRAWHSCNPMALFDAPIVKKCPENFENIKRTLEREIRSCEALIIWTDCDREGENIGAEIIQVCQAVKRNIQIYRAVFSEITSPSVHRALQTLGPLNQAVSDAVDVRQELDLRIGAAFTRFQTLRLQQIFPQTLAEMIISYGSCQFPTMGFVVERFLAIEKFVPEPYWKLKVEDTRDDLTVEFRWSRGRLFEQLPCQVFLDICLENPEAVVEKIVSKPKSKWRPLPLDTIELEKQGSRKLRLNAKTTMKIAEKLYTQGFISYPRTETNIFPKEINLVDLVTPQTEHPIWGNFASRLLQEGVNPRQGKKSDQAHPPIHPTKFTNSLQGDEAKVYEFVVRHFLACLSKNAEGYETIVDIDVGGEKFVTNGLQIIAKNYLEVYIYEKWNAKEIHIYEEGQRFRPTEITMVEERTSPPNLLTEADLIALMDKHGIGTDATHAEHIEKIKSRHYVGMQDDKHLIPGKLGIGLVMGYDKMGFAVSMSKPFLRAELERDLKLICEGQKDPKEVLQSQIDKYREVFRVALERANLLDVAIGQYLGEQPIPGQDLPAPTIVNNVVCFKCPKCGSDMTLREKRQGNSKFIGCVAFPGCKNAVWFPDTVEDVEVTNEACQECSGEMKKMKFKLKLNAAPLFGTSYTTCIKCDTMFGEYLGVNNNTFRRAAPVETQNTTNNSYSNQRPESRTMQAAMSSTQSRNTQARPNNSVPRSTTTNRSTAISQASSNLNQTVNSIASNFNVPAPRQTQQWNNRERNAPPPGGRGNSGSGPSRDNDVIVCDCHETAIQLTVRKDGPNQGRLFYKCPKPRGSDCKFFLWGDDAASSTSNSSSRNNASSGNNANTSFGTWNNQPSQSWNQNIPNNSNWNSNNSNIASGSSTEVNCDCGNPARKVTVQKESANKGRKFYSCAKGMTSGCRFFKWADENDDGDDWQGRSTSGRGRGRGRGGGGRKRKCGNCGVEGHTRKTCPNNAMD